MSSNCWGWAPCWSAARADFPGGEKSRVALGRALLASPDMLLLDEPLASLDAARRGEILPYLERLARQDRLPMLYVSHSVEEVARLADEIVVLEKGRVRAQGSVFELLTDVDGVAGFRRWARYSRPRCANTARTASACSPSTAACCQVRRLQQAAGRPPARAAAGGGHHAGAARNRGHQRQQHAALPRADDPCRRGRGGSGDACGAARLVARITAWLGSAPAIEAGHFRFAVIKSVSSRA